jgi:hypothetical protein
VGPAGLVAAGGGFGGGGRGDHKPTSKRPGTGGGGVSVGAVGPASQRHTEARFTGNALGHLSGAPARAGAARAGSATEAAEPKEGQLKGAVALASSGPVDDGASLGEWSHGELSLGD